MKSTGIVRSVDKMGRVVIPKEIRKQLNIENESDSLEIGIEGDRIILKKHHKACFFCDMLGEMVEYKGYYICENCIEKLKSLAEGNQ
jgi:transcriptional pleiotropic regulator of transition state genes